MKHHVALQLIFTGLLIFLVSCEDTDNEGSKILLTKPYAGLTDSLKRFPDNAELYEQRGLLLSQHNQHELAAADYERAFKLQPDENTTLIYVSNLLTLNKVDKAVDLLKSSISKYPDNPEFRRRLSDVYIESGDYRRALTEYEEMIRIDSFDFETWHNKGAVLLQLKDTAGAIQALEKSYSLQPIQYTGLKLADIYAAIKNPRAIQICDEILARDSSGLNTDALFAKGVYYSETKQYVKALEIFDEVIKKEWTIVDAHNEKGIVLFEQKKYDEALKVFTTAATVSNTNADAYFWMGRCYEAMQNTSLAIANYNRALSLDPSFSEARIRRNTLQR